MAYRVVLSRPAAQDREAIADYLFHSLASPQAAMAFLDEFDAVVELISDNPYCCELCRDLTLAGKGYRKALVNSYLFIYAVDVEAHLIQIIRVFHQSQDYAKLL